MEHVLKEASELAGKYSDDRRCRGKGLLVGLEMVKTLGARARMDQAREI